jgi:hypothetical protein
MKEGLAIIVQPCGWYPYVHICWLRHVEGFEWEMHDARIIRRFGTDAALSVLADKGPQSDTQLLLASKKPESIFRPNVRRCIPANEAAWKKECPRPKGWE